MGDVLVVKDGATTGKVALVKEDFPYSEASVNEHVFICRSKRDCLLPEYLFYHLFSFNGQNQIKKSIHGSAQGGIITNFAEDYIIAIPTLDTQRRIVAILEKAEETRRLRAQADELAEGLIQSVFLEMFGDPRENPEAWEVVRLGDACTSIKDGPHVSPNYVEAGVPFISVHNIINGRFDLSDVKYISNEDHREYCRRCRPEKGDVLYTKGGTTGIAKKIDVDFGFSIWVHLALLKFPKEKIDSSFLECCLNSNYCRSQARRYTRGIANRDLVLGQMAKIKIVLPPIYLQKRFAEIVGKIDALKKNLELHKYELDVLYSSLIKKAFSGELVA